MKSSYPYIVFTLLIIIMALSCLHLNKTSVNNPDIANSNDNKVLSDECRHDDNSFRCVDYVRNYDADTITFNIKGVHSIIGSQIGVRVLGIDAPEIRSKDKCEKDLAVKARDRVKVLLQNAKRIDLLNVQRDKYFRILADVVIDGRNLSEFLADNKLVVSYDGGKKMTSQWTCH